MAADGIGFRPDVEHPGQFARVGLREQAHLFGAELRITSVENRGTTIAVLLRVAPQRGKS